MQSWLCFTCLLPCVCACVCVFMFRCAIQGVIWCPSEDYNCQSSSVVIALLLESIWAPKALNCSVFRVWNNVACMQLQVQFIMRNENILKIKETFFFVFTVHCVSLTPHLTSTVHFRNSPFIYFCMHKDLTLAYQALFWHVTYMKPFESKICLSHLLGMCSW